MQFYFKWINTSEVQINLLFDQHRSTNKTTEQMVTPQAIRAQNQKGSSKHIFRKMVTNCVFQVLFTVRNAEVHPATTRKQFLQEKSWAVLFFPVQRMIPPPHRWAMAHRKQVESPATITWEEDFLNSADQSQPVGKRSTTLRESNISAQLSDKESFKTKGFQDIK